MTKQLCSNCSLDAAQCTPVGPIVVTIRDPGFIGPAGITEIFCSWSCAADWFENQTTEVTDDYLKQELSSG